MEKTCIIFGAGTYVAPKIKPAKQLVIAADGGYESAKKAGFEPDIIIGDFDSSAPPEDTEAFVVKLKRDKDDTDMLAAVKTGLRRGCDTFVIYGGTGGRLDHTVANFGVLAYLNAFGAQGYLIDEHSVATAITDGKFSPPAGAVGTVSVFAFGGNAEGVTLKGLKFPLENYELTPEFPIGVSNETTDGKRAEISVKHGTLLIFFPRR